MGAPRSRTRAAAVARRPCDERHGLDERHGILYIAQGSNTNKGAPSSSFDLLPEYALSGAVLSVDLRRIGDSMYDLPTLDDDERSGARDAGDPFGGNGGKNQALLVPDGPVQVYASSFRNPYDLVLTNDGGLYGPNGANADWGTRPATARTSRARTAATSTRSTASSKVASTAMRATRGSRTNTFSGDSQSPIAIASPVECRYLPPRARSRWPCSRPRRMGSRSMGTTCSPSASTATCTSQDRSSCGRRRRDSGPDADTPRPARRDRARQRRRLPGHDLGGRVHGRGTLAGPARAR